MRAADLRHIETLIAEYPYKGVQQLAQGFDKGKLSAFYLAGVRSGLEFGQALYVLTPAGEEPIALGGLAPNRWHTRMYGFAMGAIRPWLNTRQPEAGEVLLKQIEVAAQRERYEHLSVRLDVEDYANLHLFEEAGWRLVDVSLKFTRPMPAIENADAQATAVRNWVIARARFEDQGWIRDLAARAHSATHFFNDPALPREATERLFAGWMDRCCEGQAYRVYTMKDQEGRPIGFVSYLENRKLAEATGRRPLILDFVLIDPQWRQAGAAGWLIEQTLAREAREGFDFCELRTSAHNLPGVRLYERLGMRYCAGDFILHKKP